MIDWGGIAGNALWIAGLAVILAAFSVTYYRAQVEGTGLRCELSEPATQLPFGAGMVLVCLGLLSSGRSWWERAIWGLLAIFFVGLTIWQCRVTASKEALQLSEEGGAGPNGSPGPVSSSPQKQRQAGRLGWALMLAGLLLIVGWLAFTAVRGLTYARSLQEHLRYLEGMSQGDLGKVGFAELGGVGEHLAGMHEDLVAIRSLTGPLLPAGRLFGWVPEYGGDLAASSELLDIAVGVASAGDRAFHALSPALDMLAAPEGDNGAGLSVGEQFLPVLVEAQAELQAAQAELNAVQQARARLDIEAFSPRVRGLVERLDRYLPWFDMAVDGALLAPDLLGADGPRTYLVLAQNNQELRATGGFISGVGELHVDGGRLVSLSFSDSYAVDNLEVPHEIAPPGFQRTLFGELFFFRDANWNADFSTSAERVLEVYARDRGVQADGVIALDLSALQLLVDAVGPLQIEGIDGPVAGKNVLKVIEAEWGEPAGGSGYEWWLHRKDFMGQIASAAMDRLMAGQSLKPANLAWAMKRALDEKHILVYLADPQAADLLRAQNWDGTLPDPSQPSDVLLVVDSNVGFNKADANIERSIRYRVDLSHEEGPTAELTLSYRHLSSRPVGACVQESRYGDTYADMMERCYWDYVRVYVPSGSQLLQGPDLALPSGSLWAQNSDAALSQPLSLTLIEDGWTVWTAFFDLPTMEERTLNFDYRLPERVLAYSSDGLISYRLRVQKQPGTEAVPLRVEIVLPPDAELIDAVPTGLPALDTNLRQDREFLIVFRAGKGGS